MEDLFFTNEDQEAGSLQLSISMWYYKFPDSVNSGVQTVVIDVEVPNFRARYIGVRDNHFDMIFR